jgi:putative Holliday junction resolvase
MPRILALDYGAKRTGIAETDDLQIIASALETVETSKLLDFLTNYLNRFEVNDIVIGQAFRMTGELSEIENEILKFIKKIKNKFPSIQIHRQDEAFTSRMAMDSMIMAGTKKKARRQKGNLDKISATLILQNFLENKRNQG